MGTHESQHSSTDAALDALNFMQEIINYENNVFLIWIKSCLLHLSLQKKIEDERCNDNYHPYFHT